MLYEMLNMKETPVFLFYVVAGSKEWLLENTTDSVGE
jgi:hypothetical protein